MNSTLHGKLRDLFTRGQPLGPLGHEVVSDDISEAILCDDVTPFKEVQTHQAYLVLFGRKGSGKSAMLAELRSGLKQAKKNNTTTSDEQLRLLPAAGGFFVVSVDSWRHFNNLVRIVASNSQIDGPLSDLVPSEHFTSIWLELLWNEIFNNLFDYSMHGDGYIELAEVRKYVNGEACSHEAPEKAAKRIFDNAKKEVLNLLAKRNIYIYYLFDSMEGYPIRSTAFRKMLSGFFLALSELNNTSAHIRIHFCIPEEIKRHVIAYSSAVLKGFGSSFTIHWKPIDLLRIIAHRYRLLSSIYEPNCDWHKNLARLNFNNRDDIHQFFSQALPKKVTNRLGIDEDPLAYIIRHTQLLPRHAIAYFNAIVCRSWEDTGGFRNITEDALRDGVAEIQTLVANEILYPYRVQYPILIQRCSEILPDLSPICSFADLKRVESRFNRRIEDDISDLWRVLFDIGILGRVIPPRDAGPLPQSPERYCYGAFHFNSQTDFGMATDSEYCFHPAFTGAFGMHRRDGDLRMVYPAHVELLSLERN